MPACATIGRFHKLGGVLDFQQFAYATVATNEAERREYHLDAARRTLHAVIDEHNEQAAERATRYQVPAPTPIARHFSLQVDMGRKINTMEFYGNQLDLLHNRLIVRGQGSQFGRLLFHETRPTTPSATLSSIRLIPLISAALSVKPENISSIFAKSCLAACTISKLTHGIPSVLTISQTAANGGVLIFGPCIARKAASTPASQVLPPIDWK